LSTKQFPYVFVVGSLIYAMVCTRTDNAHEIVTMSHFLLSPDKEHLNAMKWIMRYLRGTTNLGLMFGGKKHVLVGFTDADIVGDVDSQKSTLSYMVNFA